MNEEQRKAIEDAMQQLFAHSPVTLTGEFFILTEPCVLFILFAWKELLFVMKLNERKKNE